MPTGPALLQAVDALECVRVCHGRAWTAAALVGWFVAEAVVEAAQAEAAYGLEWHKRNCALIKVAEEWLKAHHAALCEALVGNRCSGQFTVYELLTYEFVLIHLCVLG